MYCGEIWWEQLPDPVGSEPGYRRPVLIIMLTYLLTVLRQMVQQIPEHSDIGDK